jgi:hypothetical protein
VVLLLQPGVLLLHSRLPWLLPLLLLAIQGPLLWPLCCVRPLLLQRQRLLLLLLLLVVLRLPEPSGCISSCTAARCICWCPAAAAAPPAVRQLNVIVTVKVQSWHSPAWFERWPLLLLSLLSRLLLLLGLWTSWCHRWLLPGLVRPHPRRRLLL